jgi:DNA-binding transcriptional MerR regulator
MRIITLMARRDYLTTLDIAKGVGVHPNTVRLYEQWGLLPPVRRSPAGYRQFTPFHLDQMRLARLALSGPFPGRVIRRSATSLVRRAAAGDLGGALEQAYQHLATVQAELAHAETAATLLQRWAEGTAADATHASLQIGQVAALLQVTPDALRNWERNGLIQVPRHPHNRYRIYRGLEIGRLRVIRMLRSAGYSTMAILRMMLHIKDGLPGDLRQVLDTPRPDEDIYSAADRWLSTLSEQEERSLHIIAHLEEMIHKQATV